MKPLIFIHPLSKSLKLLLEVLKENAEEDNFEIFEIDDIKEAHQLVPTIGQSLCIMANPKKCAMFMQPVRKVIAKLNTKVILLSPKSIPPKTLVKFSKIGLTECIVEPVPPKTLLYKVNLLLRSIVDSDDKPDEENNDIKSLKGQNNSEDEEKSNHLKRKNQEESDDSDDLYARKKAKKSKDVEVDYGDKKPKKKEYQEEEIQTQWKGKKSQTEEGEEDTERKKSKYEEEEIETHYKNKKDKDTGNDVIEDIQKGKSNYQEDSNDDEVHKTDSTVNEEEDDHLKGKSNNQELLTKDDDQENNKPENDEDIDMYMRGKLDKNSHDEDEDEENNTKQKHDELEIEEDTKEDLLREDEDDTSGFMKGKVSQTQDLEDDQDTDYTEKNEIHEDEEPEDKKRKEIEEEIEETKSRKSLDEELIDDADDIEDERGKVDEIDKYYRGGAAKKDELEEEEDDEDNDLYLEEEDVKGRDHKQNKLPEIEEDIEDSSITKDELDLEGVDRDKDKNNQDEDSEEIDEEYYNQRKDKLQDIIDEDKDDEEALEDELEEAYKRELKKHQDIEDDSPDLKQSKTDEYEEFKRRKVNDELEVEDDTKNKGVHQKADHISTHYSSKKSTTHNDQDWNIGNRDKKVQDFDNIKKHKDLELNYGSDEDLGEQTINYEQIKKQFIDGTIDSDSKKSKKQGKKFISSERSDKEYSRTKYRLDEEESTEALDGSDEEDEIAENPIYSSDPRGLDVAIQVLNIYYKKKFENDDIFSFISKTIDERYGGETHFMIFNKEAATFELTYSDELYNTEKKLKKKVIENFQSVIETNNNKWLDTAIPTWSDNTFREDKIQYLYPFYEGITRMGICTVTFDKGFPEDKARELEVILETTRGIFLNILHIHSPGSQYKKTNKDQSNSSENKKKKGGFFSRLLKKKAS